jgi:hypothetical protein
MTNKALKFAIVFSIGVISGLIGLAFDIFEDPKGSYANTWSHVGDLTEHSIVTIIFAYMAVRSWITYKKLKNDKNLNN